MIYFDIETAVISWDDVPGATQEQWRTFSKRYSDDESPELLWYDKAAFHAEFGRAVCISAARDDGQVKSFSGSEGKLLEDWKNALERYPSAALCAHNGNGFDIPFLCRRMTILGIEIPPPLLDCQRKPWERKNVDTMEMWGFGEWKPRVKLDLLAHVLGVPSPKTDMDGSQVGEAFREGRIDEIVRYCEQDVKCLREVYKKLTA